MKDKLMELAEHWERHYHHGGAMEYMQCANELRAILDAEGDGVAVSVSPEDRFEQFVAAEIARSPEPLRELGEYLTRVLDEDQWPTADRLLLQLATHPHPARSGVVSEEDVQAACEKYNDVYEGEIILGALYATDNGKQAMRAALESYERSRK